LVIMLHGYGGNHADALVGMSPAQAVALMAGGRRLAPMALVTVDGGDGYWNPHPVDNPMAMVIRELIPFCQRLALGRPSRRIGAMGISMGGYAALLFAEKYPHLINAVAAITRRSGPLTRRPGRRMPVPMLRPRPSPPTTPSLTPPRSAAFPYGSHQAMATPFTREFRRSHALSRPAPCWTLARAATPPRSSLSRNRRPWPS